MKMRISSRPELCEHADEPGGEAHAHVRANLAASDGVRLPDALIASLRAHRWEREWQVP